MIICDRGTSESTSIVGAGWKIPAVWSASAAANVSTSWQRRLLLKRGSQLYTTSMDRADRCAIAILDTRGIVMSWHDYLPNARSYGYGVVNRHMSQFYLPEDIALSLPARHLSIASSQGVDTHLGWRRRPSGEVFWGVTVIQAIMLKQGELLGYSHVTRCLRGPALHASARTLRAMPSRAMSLALTA